MYRLISPFLLSLGILFSGVAVSATDCNDYISPVHCVSVNAWPGHKDECDGGMCTIPAAFVSSDSKQTYRKVPIPRIINGANTFHALHDVYCRTKHCVAVGDYASGRVFKPLSYVSDDSGYSWRLSKQQPEPMSDHDNQNAMEYVTCQDHDALICNSSSYHHDGPHAYAKWYTQDGGETWKKVILNDNG